MKRSMKLMEFYKNFKVYMIGGSQNNRYRALYELVPRSDRKQITVKDLENYVERLRSKHPDKEFKLNIRFVDGRKLYVISRSSYERLPDGSKRRVYDRVPIYFDLEAQKVYVPRWYVRNRRKLANYILMRTLGSLGYALMEYRGMVQ